jgi:hypothetical protein
MPSQSGRQSVSKPLRQASKPVSVEGDQKKNWQSYKYYDSQHITPISNFLGQSHKRKYDYYSDNQTHDIERLFNDQGAERPALAYLRLLLEREDAGHFAGSKRYDNVEKLARYQSPKERSKAGNVGTGFIDKLPPKGFDHDCDEDHDQSQDYISHMCILEGRFHVG